MKALLFLALLAAAMPGRAPAPAGPSHGPAAAAGCNPPGHRVLRIELVDARADTGLGPLGMSGRVVNLATGPTPQISFRAVTCPDTVGSVEYRLTRLLPPSETVTIVSERPYAFMGQAAGDYAPWMAGPGFYRLKARAWSGPGGTGAASPFKEVSFSVRRGVKL